jgi:hypothetical protein
VEPRAELARSYQASPALNVIHRILEYYFMQLCGYDGLNYVDDCADINLYKTVFKLIFEALQQEQHYKMMMGEDAE